MVHFFYTHSKSRKYWIVLILSIIGLECITFFIQYIMLLKPCTLCIYQRYALYGISIAGIIALINPKIKLIRYTAIFIWLCSALQGLILAKKQIYLIIYPSSFFACDLSIKFPNWLPLHEWLPTIFNIYKNCTTYTKNFLSLGISQWMFLIFFFYLIIVILVIISQIAYFRR